MHPDCPSRRVSEVALAEAASSLGMSSGLCSRREVLGRTALGIGGIAASMLLAREGLAGGRQAIEIDPLAPLAVRKPHLPGKAKKIGRAHV